MKQLITSICIMAVIMLAVMSCDEGVVSEKHVYTEEELAFRDSLEAAKNNVKANYAFVYNVNLPYDDVNYSGVQVNVDTDLLIEKLGFSTLEELTAAMGTISAGTQTGNTVKFFALNRSSGADNTQPYTANNFGHWFDSGGDVCSWGAVAYLFSELDAETFTFSVGQFPAKLTIGTTYKVVQLIQKDDYRVAFILNVKVVDKIVEPEYVDPETPPAGEPETVEKTFDVTQTYANDWSANSRVDVKEVLRQAFKMTTYQIYQAIEAEEIVFTGLNADDSPYEDEEGNPVSTAGVPGHWFAATGDVTTFGDVTNKPTVYSELARDKDVLEFSIGHHPDNAKSGDEVTIKQVAELNGGKVTFTFKIKIE